ncbi:VOC family protein [Gemmobacter serpentinus]|uniref:VOC family protein n=1 Tax=Gemmobacter serpentinus TaxID=2652247 RepID=UPI00124D89C6|nr:VOC family protein [Gemmobacter serpentinus]
MSFDPYIHFPGTCAQAMAFYQSVFGGDLQMMRYADMPDAPPEYAGSDLVMHSTLAVGGRIMMAGDFPPGMVPDPQKAVSISHFAADIDDAARIFAALSDGAEIMLPFGQTFWSNGYGMLKDRFGTHWMIAATPRAD